MPEIVRDAATVVLLRDGSPGLEVFLLQRVRQMSFAAGMTVFPGGGVDKRDSDADIAWHGPSAREWAEVFGTTAGMASALVCAAARETFEECGVLLAGHSGETVVADASIYQTHRARIEARELAFSEFLAQENLVLRTDLLRPMSNWITPPREGKRYDTRFFLAELPSGQAADGNTSEAASSGWRTPQAALTEFAAGQRMLMPPTWAQLDSLRGFATVAQALAAERVIEPIQPALMSDDGPVVFAGSEQYYDAINNRDA